MSPLFLYRWLTELTWQAQVLVLVLLPAGQGCLSPVRQKNPGRGDNSVFQDFKVHRPGLVLAGVYRTFSIMRIMSFVLTGLAMAFTLFGGLETIATFSSMTFLLVSIAVSVANFRLRSITNSNAGIILIGMGLMFATVILLLGHLWSHERPTLFWLIGFFLSIAIVEIFFCHRECPVVPRVSPKAEK